MKDPEVPGVEGDLATFDGGPLALKGKGVGELDADADGPGLTGAMIADTTLLPPNAADVFLGNAGDPGAAVVPFPGTGTGTGFGAREEDACLEGGVARGGFEDGTGEDTCLEGGVAGGGVEEGAGDDACLEGEVAGGGSGSLGASRGSIRGSTGDEAALGAVDGVAAVVELLVGVGSGLDGTTGELFVGLGSGFDGAAVAAVVELLLLVSGFDSAAVELLILVVFGSGLDGAVDAEELFEGLITTAVLDVGDEE